MQIPPSNSPYRVLRWKLSTAANSCSSLFLRWPWRHPCPVCEQSCWPNYDGPLRQYVANDRRSLPLALPQAIREVVIVTVPDMSDPWSGHPVDPAVAVTQRADDLMDWEALIAAKPYVTCEHGRHRICIKCDQQDAANADALMQAMDADYEEFPHDE